jgi:hypothetical protein
MPEIEVVTLHPKTPETEVVTLHQTDLVIVLVIGAVAMVLFAILYSLLKKWI